MKKSARANALARLPEYSVAEGEPVFGEAWEAEAFALVLRLHEAGHFTWTEWSQALATEVAAAREAGDPDLGDTYYHRWLDALERLCADKQLVSRPEAAARKAAWQRAYRSTPHGKPVRLP